jgi:hypothetical protein
VIAVRHTRGKAQKMDAHAKAVLDLERIERELARAQNRWQKQRALVKRLEAKADKRWAEAIPGSGLALAQISRDEWEANRHARNIEEN